MTNPTLQPAWEEEFAKEEMFDIESSEESRRKVKDFIRSLLKENTAATLREVIAVIPETLDKPFGNEGVRHGWDTVRRIIIKRITKLTSEL